MNRAQTVGGAPTRARTRSRGETVASGKVVQTPNYGPGAARRRMYPAVFKRVEAEMGVDEHGNAESLYRRAGLGMCTV